MHIFMNSQSCKDLPTIWHSPKYLFPISTEKNILLIVIPLKSHPFPLSILHKKNNKKRKDMKILFVNKYLFWFTVGYKNLNTRYSEKLTQARTIKNWFHYRNWIRQYLLNPLKYFLYYYNIIIFKFLLYVSYKKNCLTEQKVV